MRVRFADSRLVEALGLGAHVHPFALRSVDRQRLRGLWSWVADPVGCAGVELGHLARRQHQVAATEHQAQPPGEDVEPLIAFVSPRVWPRVGARRQDLLERL